MSGSSGADASKGFYSNLGYGVKKVTPKAPTATNNKGYTDFGGKMLAPTDSNLSLLERSQTEGIPKPMVLGNETHAPSNRIRERGANIEKREFKTPGRRQSLLKDVLALIHRGKSEALRRQTVGARERTDASLEGADRNRRMGRPGSEV